MGGVVVVFVCVLSVFLWGRTDAQLNCDPQNIMLGLGGLDVGVVDIDSVYAIIGVPSEREATGSVNIYEKDPADGIWKGGLVDDSIKCDRCRLGQAVAISQRLGLALVGAPYGEGGGKVLVFRRIGDLNGISSNWKLIDTIHPFEVDSNAKNVKEFGSSVSLALGSPKSQSGFATVVIGASGTQVGEDDNVGSVYVLTTPYPYLSLPPTWNVSFTLYGKEKNGQLGYSSSISNSATNVVIGEPGGVGKVHIVVSNPVPSPSSRTWVEQQVLTAKYPNTGYGISVATWGSTTEDGNTAWSEQGALSGFPTISAAQYWDTTTFNDDGVDYNQTLYPTNGENYFGTSVSVDHNSPGGCVLPIVSSSSYFHFPSTSTHNKQRQKREKKENNTDSYVYSFMYHNGYGNPWEVNTTISSSVLPPECDASSFGQSISVSNGTAIISSGGCFTIWCTGVVCG